MNYSTPWFSNTQGRMYLPHLLWRLVARIRGNYAIRASSMQVHPALSCRLCSLKGHALDLLLYCYRLEILTHFIFELMLCGCSLMGQWSGSRADTPSVSTHTCRRGYSGTIGNGQKHQRCQRQPWPGESSPSPWGQCRDQWPQDHMSIHPQSPSL